MGKRIVGRLGGLIRVKHGFAFSGRGFTDDPSLPTLVTPGNFAIGGGFKPTKPKTFCGEVPEEFILTSGDLVVSMTDLSREGATLGLPAVIPEGDIYLHNQRIGLIEILANDLVDKGFLHYYLRTDTYRTHILGTATGSTVRHTSPSKIYAHVATLPNLDVQRAIAEVLSALDDKIAANTNLTATVDKLLTADMSRRLASADVTCVPLREIAAVNARSVKPKPSGSLRYIDIASIGVGVYDYPDVSSWHDAPSRARRSVRRGDILWSTVRPNRRSHALNLSDDPLLVGSTGLAVVTPLQTGFAYLYEILRRPEFTTYLESSADGSAYPAVRADRFAEGLVPLLEREERNDFEGFAAPLRELVSSMNQENRTLSAIRDALLPHLMSGKLRVKDGEKTAEEVL